MYFARAIRCFDEPRGKDGEHLSSGNPHRNAKKQKNIIFFHLRKLWRSGSNYLLIKTILGEVTGLVYLPVFLQLVVCRTAGGVDSRGCVESKEVQRRYKKSCR